MPTIVSSLLSKSLCLFVEQVRDVGLRKENNDECQADSGKDGQDPEDPAPVCTSDLKSTADDRCNGGTCKEDKSLVMLAACDGEMIPGTYLQTAQGRRSQEQYRACHCPINRQSTIGAPKVSPRVLAGPWVAKLPASLLRQSSSRESSQSYVRPCHCQMIYTRYFRRRN